MKINNSMCYLMYLNSILCIIFAFKGNYEMAVTQGVGMSAAFITYSIISKVIGEKIWKRKS